MNNTKKLQQSPIKCWDIYAMHLLKQATKFNKQLEIEILKTYSKKYNWLFDFENVILNTEFDAIILTKADKSIEWVNKGFTKMTGYTANYAKGRKPNFLQGKKTSKIVLKSISNDLKQGHFTKETIINYRENGEIYNCNIEIHPLTNSNNDITHFVAFEKETQL